MHERRFRFRFALARRDGESAKCWLRFLPEIKNRGVPDVCMLVCDGFKACNTLEETSPVSSQDDSRMM